MCLPIRFGLLLAFSSTLTSCGTASHYLGKVGGLVNAITSPVLGAIRLSDDTPAAPAEKPYDSRRSPAKRSN